MIRKGQYWELIKLDETNPEHELFDSVISEFTEISGWPILYYIKLNSEMLDKIYGEDTTSEYTKGYETKLIYEPTEELNILDSFGISSDDTIQYMQIPKSLFSETIVESYIEDYSTETTYKPKAGDTIRTMWNNRLYEIVDVGAEQKIFQGKKQIWEFVTKPYRDSKESESSKDMLYDTPDDFDFPDINIMTETKELSSYGDNKLIEDKSDEIEDYNDIDSTYYGY